MISKTEEKILVDICKKLSIKLFIIFGSRAKGTNFKDSDWDFAIFTQKDKIGQTQKTKLFEELEKITKFNKIDIIHLNHTQDPLLWYEIFTKGICLYEKDKGLFDNMQTNSIFNFIDYKPLYLIEEQIVNKRLEEIIT